MSNGNSTDLIQCAFDDDDQCETITIVRRCLGSLSLTGCLFILGSIVITRRYRNFGQRLIMYLTISASLDTIPYFMGHPDEDDNFCTFQAFMMTWFDWSVLLWVCCLTHSLYVNVIKLRPSEQYERMYQFTAWGLALMIAMIPLIAGMYGPAGMWCWVRSEYTWMQFGIWYFPLFVTIFVLFCSNGYIFYSVNKKARQWQGTYNPAVESDKKFLKEQVQPLKFYPVVYLLISFFPLINRIQNASSPDEPVFALYLIHSIMSPLQGFLNAGVYAANTDAAFWKQCNKENFAKMFSTGSSLQVYNISADTAEILDSNEEDDSEDEGEGRVPSTGATSYSEA